MPAEGGGAARSTRGAARDDIHVVGGGGHSCGSGLYSGRYSRSRGGVLYWRGPLVISRCCGQIPWVDGPSGAVWYRVVLARAARPRRRQSGGASLTPWRVLLPAAPRHRAGPSRAWPVSLRGRANPLPCATDLAGLWRGKVVVDRRGGSLSAAAAALPPLLDSGGGAGATRSGFFTTLGASGDSVRPTSRPRPRQISRVSGSFRGALANGASGEEESPGMIETGGLRPRSKVGPVPGPLLEAVASQELGDGPASLDDRSARRAGLPAPGPPSRPRPDTTARSWRASRVDWGTLAGARTGASRIESLLLVLLDHRRRLPDKQYESGRPGRTRTTPTSRACGSWPPARSRPTPASSSAPRRCRA